MSKISVENFVKMYKVNSKAKDLTFKDFIKKHIVTDYVDFVTKDVYCTNIVRATTHAKEGEIEYIKINSTYRYMFFVLRLIELYTDIELDFENGGFVKQYDELNKVGAIDTIINAIPESEYSEFSTLLNMKMDDFYQNEYSVPAILYNFKQSLSISSDAFNSALEEVLKKIDAETDGSITAE